MPNTSQHHNLQGTIRDLSAEETLSRLKMKLEDFGITRVADVTGLDNIGIPVMIAIRPTSKHLSTSQGKGITKALAEISAIMECVELFHAEQTTIPYISESYNFLLERGYEVFNPYELPKGIKWNLYNHNYKINWVLGYNITSAKDTLLPQAYFSLNTVNPNPECALFEVSTNGLASGNTFKEALLHAIYELVERESEFDWEKLDLDQRNLTVLDNETVQEPILKDLLIRFGNKGLQPIVWDVTGKTNIPTYRCILIDNNHPRYLGRFHGSGTHLSKSIALSRALTEAAQARLTLISGSRDDIFPHFYEEQFLYVNQKIDVHGIVDFSATHIDVCPGNSFDDDLAIVRGLIEKYYKHIIYFDLTDKVHNIPVVYALIPGMRFSGNRI